MDANVASTGRLGARRPYQLSFVRLPLESRQKQRAFGELALAGRLSACKRVEADGGSWSTQLSHQRLRRIAVSPLRIPTQLRRFPTADSAGVLLFIRRSCFGRLHISWQNRLAWNVRKSF